MRNLSTLILILFSVTFLSLPAMAETAILKIHGDSLNVPLPGSFKNVSEERNMPEYTLLLETRVVEQWEKAGEFSDGMLVIGWPYASTDDTVQQQRFDAMFIAIGKGLLAKSKGEAFTPSSSAVAKEAYSDIMSFLGRGGVGNVSIVEDTPSKKSYVFDGAFEMPGVVTFPLVEDVSLVRARGKLIVFHTWRLADKPSVRTKMLRVSKQLRTAIVRANPS
ncbi:MAG: hypothetical protein P1U83_10525 [Roseovarius sp.]|nr:hypothetical protein [Roseovarius sp.]